MRSESECCPEKSERKEEKKIDHYSFSLSIEKKN
jgi:hypothetical protein